MSPHYSAYGKEMKKAKEEAEKRLDPTKGPAKLSEGPNNYMDDLTQPMYKVRSWLEERQRDADGVNHTGIEPLPIEVVMDKVKVIEKRMARQHQLTVGHPFNLLQQPDDLYDFSSSGVKPTSSKASSVPKHAPKSILKKRPSTKSSHSVRIDGNVHSVFELDDYVHNDNPSRRSSVAESFAIKSAKGNSRIQHPAKEPFVLALQKQKAHHRQYSSEREISKRRLERKNTQVLFEVSRSSADRVQSFIVNKSSINPISYTLSTSQAIAARKSDVSVFSETRMESKPFRNLEESHAMMKSIGRLPVKPKSVGTSFERTKNAQVIKETAYETLRTRIIKEEEQNVPKSGPKSGKRVQFNVLESNDKPAKGKNDSVEYRRRK